MVPSVNLESQPSARTAVHYTPPSDVYFSSGSGRTFGLGMWRMTSSNELDSNRSKLRHIEKVEFDEIE